jgi:hypothetical protein
MVRAAKQGAGPWVGAAIRSMERAARMATAARAAGHVSPACADGLMRVLGDARAAAAPLREARPVVE